MIQVCFSLFFAPFTHRYTALSQKKALAGASAFFNEINPCGFVKYPSDMKYAVAY